MAISDLISMVAFAALVFIEAPLALVLITLLATVCEGPFFPASVAALPNLARTDRELARAGSQLGASHNLGQAIGYAAGGLIFLVVGAAGLFAVNSASFLFSALLVLSIQGSFQKQREGEVRRPRAMEGIRRSLRQRSLRLNFTAKTISGVVYGMYWTAIPLLAYTSNQGSLAYGLMLAAWGGGLSVGCLLAGRVYTKEKLAALLLRGRAQMGSGILVAGLAALLISSDAWVGLVVFSMLWGAIGGGYIEVGDQLLVQWVVEDQMRGQVTAAGLIPSKALFALSVAAGAIVIPAIGAAQSFLLTAAVMALACGPIWVLRREWDLEERVEEDEIKLQAPKEALGSVSQAELDRL